MGVCANMKCGEFVEYVALNDVTQTATAEVRSVDCLCGWYVIGY